MENNKLEAAILQISTEERAVNYQWEKDADKLDKTSVLFVWMLFRK